MIGDWSRRWPSGCSSSGSSVCCGALDDTVATRVSAELMTLDARGRGGGLAHRLRTGSLAVALTLMDVIELLGVPVRAMCLGQVGAAAIGVLSVAAHRSALPSTRFSLKEPATSWQSNARDVAQLAQLHADERARFCARLAAATRRSEAQVAADLSTGAYMGAEEAQRYGIIDKIRAAPGRDPSARWPNRVLVLAPEPAPLGLLRCGDDPST